MPHNKYDNHPQEECISRHSIKIPWAEFVFLWIKIAGRNSSLRYADAAALMAESKEKLKSLLMRVKEESGKACLKLNIQKTKIMASGPVTSWQTQGENVEAVTEFIFLDSKITADGCLLFGRKAMTNLDSVLKSRDITLLTKVPYSQSCGFSSSHVRVWELHHKECWTLKNWCFWAVVLEKTTVWEFLGLQGDQTSQF